MKIKNVKIKNYHSIVECEFDFSNFLALIGENNAGKSNIIYALNLFFTKEKPGYKYSFNNPDEPIEIIIEFKDLTKKEKDEISEKYRDGDKFILKKIYSYNLELNRMEIKMVPIKGGEEMTTTPRGAQNVLADSLPEFYLLRAVKYCSEELKTTKTTNFSKFLNLAFKQFEKDFHGWDKIIEELKKETHKTNEDAPLVKISKEISKTLKEQFSEADVKLKPKTISRLDILNALDVFIDDDREIPLLNQGQGTQRAFIFAILRLLAEKINKERPVEDKEEKNIIIAIEEPELFLHPQQQKIVYLLIKELAQQTKKEIQVIYSTHSSFMVHVEDYNFIGLVKKTSASIGTKIFQHIQEIFSPESKEEFQLLCQFDPERNEMFFAKKVIFVEGPTEKFSLPIILSKNGINVTQDSISIIECGGKAGTKLFLEVVNKFNQNGKVIDCLVMHDKDIPWKDPNDKEKEKKEEQAKKDNQDIEDLCSLFSTPLFVFEPDFERKLKLSIGKKNKPYNARKSLFSLTKDQIPQDIKDFIDNNL